MATYLLAIEIEYEKELTEEQLAFMSDIAKQFGDAVAVKAAVTDWPENKSTKWLLKWRRSYGSQEQGNLLSRDSSFIPFEFEQS